MFSVYISNLSSYILTPMLSIAESYAIFSLSPYSILDISFFILLVNDMFLHQYNNNIKRKRIQNV